MRVSLIIPKDQNPEKPVLFLGVLYLASYLKQRGIDVKIYDEQFDEATNKIDEILENSGWIGFTVMTSQLKSAKELSQLIRSKNRCIPIIWGGFHPLLFPEQCLREEYIDYLIYDEGEETLCELVKLNPITEIKGLWYKKDNDTPYISHNNKYKFIKNPPREYIDLNQISPDWTLIDINRYEQQMGYEGEKHETFRLLVGKGCPYKCSFCIQTLLNQRKHRGLTAENIVKEIKRILEFKPNIKSITLVDDNFFMNLERAKEFCRLYKQEGFKFKWIATSRVNYIIKMDNAFLKELKECNCILMSLGLESGSQRVLDELIHKEIKKDDIIKAIEKIKPYNIGLENSFMIGIPGETIEEQNETFALIKKISKMYKNQHIIGPQLYRPYPGAEMYQMAKQMGFKEPASIDEWISFLNNFGFLDINQLTWIPNKKQLIQKTEIYTFSQINPKGLAKPLGLLFRSLFRLRIKYNCYHYPVELKIYKLLKNIYNKVM